LHCDYGKQSHRAPPDLTLTGAWLPKICAEARASIQAIPDLGDLHYGERVQPASRDMKFYDRRRAEVSLLDLRGCDSFRRDDRGSNSGKF
jgi:hypothetical protein